MTSDFDFIHSRFNVSRETYEKLKAYQELLLKWQSRINLIGPDTVSDAWQRHFVDSLQLLPLIGGVTPKSFQDLGDRASARREAGGVGGACPQPFTCEGQKARFVDMGTGAGFPGMVLAVCGYADVHLIESDTKKITFLREVARITSANVQIHHTRMEHLSLESVAVVTSRACASLSELFRYAQNYVSRETQCYFHKGKNSNKELLDSQSEWLFDYSAHPSITDASASILRIANLRMRPN